jgi:hypothetical protein
VSDVELEAAVGKRHGKKRMPIGKRTRLAHVKERDLPTVRHPGFQRCGIDRGTHDGKLQTFK